MRGKSYASAVLAASLLGTLASAALGDNAPVGPPIGNNKYRTVIQDVGDEQDVDAYAQTFVKGELLTVTVTGQPKPSGGNFLPILELVDPDGLVRFADVLYTKENRVASLSKFAIDKSGGWAATIRGRDGDQGAYVVSFAVKPLSKIEYKNQRLGNDKPFSRTHTFAAFDGANLDAKLVFDRRGLDVEMRALLDPSGADVLDAGGRPAVASAVTSGDTVKLKGVRLSKGDGDYSLRVRIPTAEGRYSLEIRVDPGDRPSSKKVKSLSANEPVLAARLFPLAGEPGESIRLEGINFAQGNPAPTVLFDENAATGVVVGPDGTYLDCIIPPRGANSVADVTVINPDGQVAHRDHYFAYVPPPIVTDFVDAATGNPIRAVATTSQKAVSIVGENFLLGQVVTVGGVAVTGYTVPDPTRINFTLPAIPQGMGRITVSDEFGRSSTSDFEVFFKTPPAFHPTNPYSPGALQLNVAATVTIRGTGFDATDQLEFAGSPVTSTFVDSTTRTFGVPALGQGSYSIVLIDAIGTRIVGPNLDVKLPPTISAVNVVGPPVIGTRDIPLAGGSTIQVDGSNFGGLDVVTLGGTQITTFIQRTSTRLQFAAPPNAGGSAGLTILDGAGQTASVSGAVNYVGFVDATAARKDAGSSLDDFRAHRGVVGDLDLDGATDDAVIVSEYGTQIGTRQGLARLFLGDATGKLKDVTATRMPGSRTDSSGTDVFDASAVALGDVDKSGSPDLVLAGVGGSLYYPQYYGEVRILKNTSGTFALDEGIAPPTRYQPAITVYFNYYGTLPAYSAVYPQGSPRGMALGDLDKDGDVDLVVGNDHYDSTRVGLDPRFIDFTKNPPVWLGTGAPYTHYYYYAKNYILNTLQYRTATRLYDNQIAGGKGFVETTKTRLPSAGDNNKGSTPKRAFHCTDLALGDLDVDGDLDLVVAWNDPQTVTPLGLYSKTYSGVSSDTPKVATAVLINNGTGFLTTDATATWLPSGSQPEFWQADRIALDDLDGDGDPDLLLLVRDSLDAYLGTPTYGRSALRVLRNDRTRFVDVTVSALPAVNAGSLDNFRGETIAVRDVNGDGRKDILIGTTENLTGPAGQTLRRTRLLAGSGTLRWSSAADFMVPLLTDTGETNHAMFVPDLGGTGNGPLLLLSNVKPSQSPAGEKARVLDWKK